MRNGLSILLFLFGWAAYAQTDSLQRVLGTLPNDTSRLLAFSGSEDVLHAVVVSRAWLRRT